MTPILLRKVVRDLRSRRASLIALLFIMGFGISSLICFLSVYRDLAMAKDDYYQRYRLASMQAEIKRAPASIVSDLRYFPNVSAVRGRVNIQALIDIPGVPDPISGRAISLPARRVPVLNDVVLRSGTWFSGEDEREVIITDAFAKANGLRPGSHIKVLLLDQQHEFLVVGTASSPEFVYLVPPGGGLAPDPARFGAVYLPERFLQEAADLDGACNQILVSLKDTSKAALREMQERLMDHLDLYGVAQVRPMLDQPSPQFLENELENVRKSSTITPVIFLCTAALILNVLVARLVSQQRGVIGTLKALGYTSWQVLRHYLSYGVAIGLIGGVAGGVFGNIFHVLMLKLYRAIFAIPEIRYHFHTDLYIWGVAISVLAATAGTIKGVRAAARLEPAAAMQPPPPEKGRRIVLERIPAFWNRLSFRARMIFRDVFRNPFRSLVSIAAAAIATTLMVGAFCMRDALTFLMRFEYTLVSHGDLTVSLREPRGRNFFAEEEDLSSVARTEPQLVIPCDLANGNHVKLVGVTGIDKGNTLCTPVDRSEQPIRIPETGIVLTRKLAEILHVAPGGMISLRPLIGERRLVQARVVGTVDTYVGLSAYASLDYLSRLIGEDWAANTVLIRNYRQAPTDELISEIKERPTVTSVGERERALAQFEGTFGKVNATIIGIFVIFAALIGFGSVLNSSLVSLSERQREVGTLRVLGYTPLQIAGIFAGESMLLYGIGTIIGLYLGTLYVQLLVVTYSSELFRFPAVIHADRMVQSAALMIFSIVMAQVIVYRLIDRLNWIEVLKVKE